MPDGISASRDEVLTKSARLGNGTGAASLNAIFRRHQSPEVILDQSLAISADVIATGLT